MPSLKDVKLQIAGVGKTKQITKAMGMVASSKLRGAQGRIERFRPYAEKFGSMLGDLAARTEGAAHPLLQVHDKPKTAVILLVTSDRGLCGAFNVNLITTRCARRRMNCSILSWMSWAVSIMRWPCSWARFCPACIPNMTRTRCIWYTASS